MIILLGLAIAAQPVFVGLFLHHIRESAKANDLRISGLLNRIQAPKETVTQDLIPAGEHDTVILPHDEASYWRDLHHVEVAG